MKLKPHVLQREVRLERAYRPARPERHRARVSLEILVPLRRPGDVGRRQLRGDRRHSRRAVVLDAYQSLYLRGSDCEASKTRCSQDHEGQASVAIASLSQRRSSTI